MPVSSAAIFQPFGTVCWQSDLIGLVAPRPVLVEAGTHDPIFPIAAVQAGVKIARQRVYRLWKAEEHFETDIFEGRHRISGRRAYDFLKENLV